MRAALRRTRRRWQWRRTMRRMAGPKLLEAFAETYPRATFVEIGANDGEQHDHLRPYILAGGWRGVMVEPVPYVFARLRDNYAGVAGVTLENAAIAGEDGRLPFFHLRDAGEEERARLPDWYDGVGSFSREAILSHAAQMPDIAERIVELDVEALSFETLCARHGLDALDLLLVDTEGHDWEILRHIDFARHRPRLVVYEHFHLVPEDRAAGLAHLEAAGYETMEEGLDTFALRPEPDALTRRWRRLEPAVGGVSKHDEA
jgi:FkbM family methyltransferase